MLKKITAAALSTALCVTTSISFTGNCAASAAPTNIQLSAVRSADDIPVPADLRKGETPVSKGELGNDILFFIYEDGTVYIKGSGKMADFTGTPFEKAAKDIKKAVFINDGDGITNIGNSLFCNCPILEEAEIPETVTSIGLSSFSNCPKLKKINIPKAVTSVGIWAFADDTSIEAIELPDALTLIDRGAFKGCTALKEITIPEKLSTLRAFAFQDCTSLTEVTVPENVTTIGPYAFSGCSSLKKAVIKGGSEQLGEKLFQKCTALEELTLPNADTAIFRENDAPPLKWLGTLFGDYISGYTYGASYDDITRYIPFSLKSITITGGTSIADDAFAGFGSLTAVSIPDGIEYIGNNAFRGCSAVETFKMPSKASYIGSYAFKDCKLINVDIPKGVTEIGEYAFENCSAITNINVPEATDKIGQFAFSGCSALEKAVISTCKDGFGKGIFNRCTALSTLTLPYAGFDPKSAAGKDASWLGDLFGDYISGYTYGVTHDDITKYIPFTLTDLTITGGTNIPDDSLLGFSSLTSVSIPDGTEYIGNNSFRGCSALEKFKMPSKAAYIGSYAFSGCGKINVDIPEGVTEIGERAFENCTSITEINVPDATNKIGEYAFSGCSSLKKAVISTCKDGFGKGIFNRCTALSDLTLPYAGFDPKSAAGKDSSWLGELFGDYISGYTYGVSHGEVTKYIPFALTKLNITGGTNIPDDSLYGFSSLTSVSIPDETEYIGNNSFRGCSALEEFTMPSKANYIGAYAFDGCVKISTDIPKGVTEIGESAFNGCRYLTEINVPAAAKSIGAKAFADCAGLKKVVINGSDTVIGENCFGKCTALESLTLPFVIPDDIKKNGSDSSWFKDFFGDYVSGYTYGVNTGSSVVYVPYTLTELTITNGKELPADALSNLQLENITLPKTIESIGNNALNGCNSVMNIFYPDKQEAWDKVKVGENNTVLDEKLRVLGADGEYNDVVTKATTTTVTTTTAATTTVTTTTVTQPSADYTLGDVDNSKAVDAVDASTVLTDYAMTSTNQKSELTDVQKKAADVDANGAINAVDASYILEYYAYTATHKDETKLLTMAEYMAKKAEPAK